MFDRFRDYTGGPMRYRKKPVEVEARQYVHRVPQDAAPFLRWIRSGGASADFDPSNGSIRIGTLEGVMEARSGDYIIRGTRGEFYPCKSGPFEDTFEAI